MDPLTEKIKDLIQSQNLFTAGDRALVCVSGGPDSTFLLYMLKELAASYKLKLSVAHLNHCLRGKESDQDEVFVGNLAKKFNLSFYSKKVDVEKVARRQNLCLEDAARRARYDFFIKIASRYNIKKIALAHTKDDQAETILMRILRGTGLKGLGGMKMQSSLKGKDLVRPLLEIEKKEILQYLKKKGIKSRLDSSNLKTDYFRNKVRLKVIPFILKLAPQFKNNLFKISQMAQEIEAFMQGQLSCLCKKYVRKINKDSLRIKRNAFLRLAIAERRGLIRKMIKMQQGDLKNIDFKHIKIIEDFIKENKTSPQGLDLPRQLKVKIAADNIIFTKKKIRISFKPRPGFKLLDIGKELNIPGFGFKFLASKVNKKVRLKRHSKFVEYFDQDKLKFPLTVRSRRNGDIFFPLGALGKKKLKKFFIDEKVKRSMRNNVPLIVCGGDIIWVVGMRISDRYKVAAKTKAVLKIQAKKI